MRSVLLTVFSVLCSLSAHAQGTAANDEQTQQFSDYIYKVANLNGQFHGVHDYCAQYAPQNILDNSRKSWNKTNGVYIEALDLAIDKYVHERVEESRRKSVAESLSENVKSWFSKAHDDNKLLAKIRESESKGTTCSYYLGVMVSASFDFKKLVPDVYDYWNKHLKP
jgi:hypothetical protein